jgi:hypothetical protein
MQCWLGATEDIAFGVAATATNSKTGQELRNWTWTLSWPTPPNGAPVGTYDSVFLAVIFRDIDTAKSVKVIPETAFFHNPRRGLWLPHGTHRLHPRQPGALQHRFNFIHVEESAAN